MTRELIITNGDSAAGSLMEARLAEEVLPWRDVLHEGPVPDVGDLGTLSELRTRWLASIFWADYDEALEGVMSRDSLLADNESFDRLSLWFEHDLYDQLQLIQILSYMADNPRRDGELYLLQADDYLGRLSPDDMIEISPNAGHVTSSQLVLAKAAWWAFSQDTPETWAKLLNEDISALPYLKPTVIRMLEELPGKDGLSRTERQILQTINDGSGQVGPLFGASQKLEDAIFMGDWSFFTRLQNLATSLKPAIYGLGSDGFSPSMSEDERKAFFNRELRLNDFGRALLDGEEDFAAHNEIDFWWGGTLVTNDDLWRWDGDKGVLMNG